MTFLLYLLLSYVMPLALVLTAAAFWWRVLFAPWIFLVVTSLSMVGLRTVVAGAWNLAKLSTGEGGFTLDTRPENWEGALMFQSVGQALLVLALGIPLLLATKNVFTSASQVGRAK